MSSSDNYEVLGLLNIAYKNESEKRIREEIDSAIRIYLNSNPDREKNPVSNLYSVMSNYLRDIVKNKNVNPNFILSSVIKHTKNYLGLYLIGMLIREGANPNIYFNLRGYGNIHIIAYASLRNKGSYDPYFRYICNVLRLLGSDIYYPAFKFEGSATDMDISLVEDIFNSSEIEGNDIDRTSLNVKQFVSFNSKTSDEILSDFLNSISVDDLLNVIIATDDVKKFELINKSDFFTVINENIYNLTRFFIDLSTADAMNIAASLTIKEIPMIDELINAQPIPLYVATISLDQELFRLYITKGSNIKYVTINNLVSYYKVFKNNEIKLYKNCYYMLLDAINIGADIDLYQFNMFVSAADFDEIEDVRKAYQVPKWKKLCSLIHEKPREELKQIAFDLNLDYNMSEEQICNKLKQISLIDTKEYFISAVKRQEDRISSDVASSEEYVGENKPTKSRCSEKTMILKNPYAYNDARLAFYKDPEDGEVWCFTSDTFSSLITTKINPYNGNPLPLKFIETLKSQMNILKELGVYNYNTNIEDTLKEVYSRSTINNKKTDYCYETIIKCLAIYGVSQERFDTLRLITQEDTILEDICGIALSNFSSLSPMQRNVTVARIIYSLAKNNKINPEELFQNISRAIVGELNLEELPTENMQEYSEMFNNNY